MMLSDSRDGDISAHPSGIVNASEGMVPPGNLERVAAEIPQVATRMGSTVGTIKPFDVSQPDGWDRYLIHIELHFRANGFSDFPPAVQRHLFVPRGS